MESVYRNCEYDVEKMKKVIEEFKKKKYKPSNLKIAFDMDNTLCLYSINGDDETALKNMWYKNFYRNLPCFEEAPAVIELLQQMGFTVLIISSCINSKYCKQEKIEWLHYHLPMIKDENIILVNNGENKSDYIDDISTTILVDDYYKNLMNWYDAGGIGIKKTYSGKKRPILQVNSLVEIVKILWDLGIIGELN